MINPDYSALRLASWIHRPRGFALFAPLRVFSARGTRGRPAHISPLAGLFVFGGRDSSRPRPQELHALGASETRPTWHHLTLPPKTRSQGQFLPDFK